MGKGSIQETSVLDVQYFCKRKITQKIKSINFLKPMENIILNSNELSIFHLIPETTQTYPFSPLLFHIVVEFLVSTARLNK